MTTSSSNWGWDSITTELTSMAMKILKHNTIKGHFHSISISLIHKAKKHNAIKYQFRTKTVNKFVAESKRSTKWAKICKLH